MAPSDIKQEGTYRYFDLSDEHIVVLDGDNGVKAKVGDTEDGYRVFEFDNRTVELPPSQYAPVITQVDRAEIESFKAKLSPNVDEAHALKLLGLSRRRYYEGLANATMAKQLTNSDIDALSAMAERNLTSAEIEATDVYKYAKRYAEEHPQLKVSEHPDLVQRVKSEFKETIIAQARERNGGKEPPKNHKAVFVAGLPGAGKSSGVAKRYLDAGAIEFDNDIAKAVPSLSEYYADGLGAGTVQNIVSEAQKGLWGELLSEGYDIVYPAIGKRLDKVQEELQRFADYGYDVDYVLVHVSNATSQNRAFKRYVETGRFVDPVGYIKGLGEAPDEVYNSIRYGNQEAQQGRNSQDDPAADNRQGEAVRRGDGLRVQSRPDSRDTAQGSGSGGPEVLPDGSNFVYRYVTADGHNQRITLNSIERIDREPSITNPRPESGSVSRTPLEEVQSRYRADVGDANPSIIIEAANAKRGKTYSYNRTRSMVNDIETYVRDMLTIDNLPEEYRQFFRIDSAEQGDITRQVFAQLNLSKNEGLNDAVK